MSRIEELLPGGPGDEGAHAQSRSAMATTPWEPISIEQHVERNILTVHRADDGSGTGSYKHLGDDTEFFACLEDPKMGQSTCRTPRSDEGDLQALHTMNMPEFFAPGKSAAGATPHGD